MVSSASRWLLLSFAVLFLTVGAAPVKAAPPSPMMPREQMQDPYLPGPGQLEDGPRSIPRTPPGSVQVNVNGAGMNIVGDAANEPSIAIDPTNPQRMAITWRQFDTIASNFRQGGYAYTTNGGASWTFPGVIEPGTFNSDPVLAADSAGRFFWSALHSNFCQNTWQSSNAGQTWPSHQGGTAYGGDKQWIAVDRTGGIGGGFDLTWSTIDGGGAMNSTGGAFSLDGTIGQPDAQVPPVMIGGTFALTGGFWPVANVCFCLADMNGDGKKNGADIQKFVGCILVGGNCS